MYKDLEKRDDGSFDPRTFRVILLVFGALGVIAILASSQMGMDHQQAVSSGLRENFETTTTAELAVAADGTHSCTPADVARNLWTVFNARANGGVMDEDDKEVIAKGAEKKVVEAVKKSVPKDSIAMVHKVDAEKSQKDTEVKFSFMESVYGKKCDVSTTSKQTVTMTVDKSTCKVSSVVFGTKKRRLAQVPKKNEDSQTCEGEDKLQCDVDPCKEIEEAKKKQKENEENEDSEEKFETVDCKKLKPNVLKEATVHMDRCLEMYPTKYLSNWMSQIKDGVAMNHLSIPGAHDAGALGGYISAQSKSITKLLETGLRFMDFRIRIRRKNAMITHNVLDKISLRLAMSRIRDWLASHVGEVVVVSLKMEADKEHDNPTDHKKLIAGLRGGLKDSDGSDWVEMEADCKPKDGWDLGAHRGKIMFLCDRKDARWAVLDDFCGTSLRRCSTKNAVLYKGKLKKDGMNTKGLRWSEGVRLALETVNEDGAAKSVSEPPVYSAREKNAKEIVKKKNEREKSAKKLNKMNEDLEKTTNAKKKEQIQKKIDKSVEQQTKISKEEKKEEEKENAAWLLIQQEWRKEHPPNKNTFLVTSLSGTARQLHSAQSTFAKDTAPYVYENVFRQQYDRITFVGVLMMDFPGPHLISAVVCANRQHADAQKLKEMGLTAAGLNNLCEKYIKESPKKLKDGCFSGNNFVRLVGGRAGTPDGVSVSVSEVGAGLSLVGLDGRRDDVYFTGHREMTGMFEFVRVETVLYGKVVSATADHFVHVFDDGTAATTRCGEMKYFDGNDVRECGQYVRFGDVVANRDRVFVRLDDGRFVVDFVGDSRRVMEEGLFNPYTMSGEMVVNDVVVSCHSKYVLDDVFGKNYSVWLPNIYQAMFLPFRCVYRLFPDVAVEIDAMFPMGAGEYPFGEVIGALVLLLVRKMKAVVGGFFGMYVFTFAS